MSIKTHVLADNDSNIESLPANSLTTPSNEHIKIDTCITVYSNDEIVVAFADDINVTIRYHTPRPFSHHQHGLPIYNKVVIEQTITLASQDKNYHLIREIKQHRRETIDINLLKVKPVISKLMHSLVYLPSINYNRDLTGGELTVANYLSKATEEEVIRYYDKAVGFYVSYTSPDPDAPPIYVGFNHKVREILPVFTKNYKHAELVFYTVDNGKMKIEEVLNVDSIDLSKGFHIADDKQKYFVGFSKHIVDKAYAEEFNKTYSDVEKTVKARYTSEIEDLKQRNRDLERELAIIRRRYDDYLETLKEERALQKEQLSVNKAKHAESSAKATALSSTGKAVIAIAAAVGAAIGYLFKTFKKVSVLAWLF
jgi:ElaB/YqjD/DUF883 family membrane-anchored ribosome-binding protein